MGQLPAEDARRPRNSSPGDSLESLLSLVSLAQPAALGSGVQMWESMAALTTRFDRLVPAFGTGLAAAAQRRVADLMRQRLSRYFKGDEQRERLWELIDLTLAVLRGLAPLGPGGLRALGDMDCADWLVRNGASPKSANNPFMNAMYSVVMGYDRKDGNKPKMAAGAGAGVYGFLLSGMYSGDYLWQLARGSGEDFFVPMYQVLKRRGVRFRFFHRLHRLRLSGDRTEPRVRRLDFHVQADVRGEDYHPLVDQNCVPIREHRFDKERGAFWDKGRVAFWPAVPDWSQVSNAHEVRAAANRWAEERGYTVSDGESHVNRHFDALEAHCGMLESDRPQSLELGRDFDLVVLGAGLGPTAEIFGASDQDQPNLDPRWREAFQRCTSLPTQSFRLWLNVPMKDLGLGGPPVTLAGWRKDFEIFIDQRHRIYSERWTDKLRTGIKPARSLCYFRGVLGSGNPDPCAPEDRGRRRVERNAWAFMNRDIKELLPDAVDASGHFRKDLISAAFHTDNSDPAFQVAQALPGTIKYRIKPSDASYPNLRVCGDWTDCGYNSPSVETAIISGRLAAWPPGRSPTIRTRGISPASGCSRIWL